MNKLIVDGQPEIEKENHKITCEMWYLIKYEAEISI